MTDLAWDRVTRGVHVPQDAGAVARWRAWCSVLPAGAALTGLTAAAARGWWLPPVPTDLPVFAAQPRTAVLPVRSGLHVTRLARPPAIEHVREVPVTAADETLLICARLLSPLDLVVLVDGALAAGSCTLEELRTFCGDAATTRRPGVRALRSALARADDRTESAWETMLRVLHVSAGIAVQLQF